MGQRSFKDENGRLWHAWEVRPTLAERRRAQRPVPIERRVRDIGPRIVLTAELRDGWLVFQSRYERRTVAPVPTGWEALPDTALLLMLQQATPRGKPRRLIE